MIVPTAIPQDAASPSVLCSFVAEISSQRSSNKFWNAGEHTIWNLKQLNYTKSFLDYPDGSENGFGAKFKQETVEIAVKIISKAIDCDIQCESFADLDGSILLTLYPSKSLQIDVEIAVDGELSYSTDDFEESDVPITFDELAKLLRLCSLKELGRSGEEVVRNCKMDESIGWKIPTDDHIVWEYPFNVRDQGSVGDSHRSDYYSVVPNQGENQLVTGSVVEFASCDERKDGWKMKF